jgi:hypothetical protein
MQAHRKDTKESTARPPPVGCNCTFLPPSPNLSGRASRNGCALASFVRPASDSGVLRRIWRSPMSCGPGIRRVGYEKHFIGRVWVYYDIGEMHYWDCGGSIETIEGLNRAVRRSASARVGL